MAGLLNGKQLVDGTVTPNKLSEQYLQVNEQGEVNGDLIVTGNTTLSETATYKGSEIATKGDLYDEGGITDLINELDEKKQDNLIAGENIQIAPDKITISSSTKVANSDRVLTYDTAGLKANITLVVDGNHIRVEGKTDENGDPYILGEFNVLQSQIIDEVYIEDGHLFITFIVDGNPGKETVDIDLSEFIDVYVGSQYIDVSGNEISLKYDGVHDQLINDGIAQLSDIPALPDLSPYVQKSTTVWGKPLTSNITGDISGTGNIIPATTNTYNIGTAANRYKDIYATNAGFTGTVTATGGFAGNATTATTLQTDRNIQLTGVVTGSASFNGSANATITTASTTLATKQEVETNTRNIATNKTAIDDLNRRIIITGDGKQFLSNDGTYKGVRDMGSGLVEGSVWRYCDILNEDFTENELRWRVIGDKIEIVGGIVSTSPDISVTNIPVEYLERVIETNFIIGLGSSSTTGTASVDIQTGRLILANVGRKTVYPIVNISIPLLDYVLNVKSGALELLSMNQHFRDITYGNGIYVAIGVLGGSSNTIIFASSKDCNNWTLKQIGLGDNYITFMTITYGNGKFVAVGTSGNYAYSQDGINWTIENMGVNVSFSCITYGNGKFVAFGGSIYACSEDGINWITGNLPNSSTLYGIAYGNDLFVALGSGSYHHYSEDGINWSSEVLGLGRTWLDIDFINNNFFAIPNSSHIASSTDGRNWIIKHTNINETFSKLTCGEGIIMVSTLTGYAYSEDGIQWKKRSLSSGAGNCITYGNGKFILMDRRGGYSVITK